MRAVAIVCFFLSGASGLIFEVIWTRMFSLVFGATTLAISTVLTAFMGGLALGSYLSGRFADRIREPLKAYAIAEAGVGLTALLVPFVVGSFGDLNRFLYEHFRDNYAILSGMRFLASSVVMIVPTTLMGATLPLLSRLFVQTESEQARVGLRVGTLYAVNTLGAVLGTASGGFLLLPNVGLTLTNRLAAGTNLMLAVIVAVAYAVRRRVGGGRRVDPEVADLLEEVEAPPAPKPLVSKAARTASLVAFALSGAIAMVYQVIWTRALSMNIGSSVYSFTIVLTAFLIGLATGAAVIGRLCATTKNPVGWLVVNHLAIVVCVGGSYLLVDKLPFVFLFLIRGEQLDATFVQRCHFLISLLTMLPATFAMGGIMPLTLRIYASGLETVGRDVGSAYSVNTIGAIVGSFLAGFVVIPLFQLQPGIYAAVCVNLAIALVLSFLASWSTAKRIAAVAVAVALGATGPLLPRWNLIHVSSGLFRLSLAREYLEDGKWSTPKLVYYRDGLSTTVSVEQWSKEHFSLKNNGKVDASTGDDMPTQITVGLLPVLLHPSVPDLKPKVALIGYASGVTAGAVLQYPVSRLDVVELEPSIRKAASFFEHVNHRPFSDRRMNYFNDDGRNFLAAGSELYDVIINEPSNPWITGVSNLFTREYFEIAKRRLKKDGVFLTWSQMYEISPRHIKSIYRTFASVFPYTYAFAAEALSSDTFIIGSNRPLKLDIRRIRRAFAIPSVDREMDRAKVRGADGLVSLALLGPGEVHAYAMGAEINTDDNALVEFGAPQDMLNHKLYDYYVSRVYGQTWIYARLDGYIDGYSSSEDYAGLVQGLLQNGRFREAERYFQRVKRDAGPRSLLAAHLMRLLASRDIEEEEVALDENGPPLTPPNAPPGRKPEEVNRIAREYFVVEQKAKAKAYRAALDIVEAWPDEFREEVGDDFELLWGYLVYKCEDYHTAVRILEPLWEKPEAVKRRPAVLYYLGRSFYGNADYSKSVKTLEGWIEYRTRVGKPVVPLPPGAEAPASAPAPDTPTDDASGAADDEGEE
jgi:spermidine synthase